MSERSTTDDQVSQLGPSAVGRPLAIIVQAKEIREGANTGGDGALIAIAVAADGLSKSLSDFRELERLKAELGSRYQLTTPADGVNTLLASPQFLRIFVRSVAVAFDTATRASIFAVWTGIEGQESASNVDYILVRAESEVVVSYGGDASKARAALADLLQNSSSEPDGSAAAANPSQPSSSRSGPRR